MHGSVADGIGKNDFAAFCTGGVLMEKRYTALRIIATIYKVMGVIFGVLAILAAIATVLGGATLDLGFGNRAGGTFVALIGAVFILLGGLLGALGVYAIGELVSLLINIEENTRFSAIILRDRLAGQPPSQPVMPPPMEQ
jgi:hypothetical protein